MTGCSTSPSHVGEVQKTNGGAEFSIKDTKDGFIVAAHYSEYQFVRNSKRGFIGCAKVINDAAESYSNNKGDILELPNWDKIQIIDHGRDILTAVMHVNCQYEYIFKK